MTRAGKLRQRVTIQKKQVTINEYGEEVITWVAFATRWAEVTPLRGREYIRAQAEGADVTHQVRLRHMAGVTPAMQLLYDGRVLEINAVIDVEERHKELELMCVERL